MMLFNIKGYIMTFCITYIPYSFRKAFILSIPVAQKVGLSSLFTYPNLLMGSIPQPIIPKTIYTNPNHFVNNWQVLLCLKNSTCTLAKKVNIVPQNTRHKGFIKFTKPNKFIGSTESILKVSNKKGHSVNYNL
jgi:hypothetical protein